MKTASLAAIFLALAFSAASQTRPSDFKTAIKIYNSIDYESFQNSLTFDDSTGAFLRTTNTELSIFRPVFAVQWQNDKGNFHELELNRFELGLNRSETVPRQQQNNSSGPPVKGSDIFHTRIAVGYQHVIALNKENEGKLALYLGLGGVTYYQWTLIVPSVSTEFPVSAGNTGLRLFLSPRLSWFFSERIFLDAQVQVFITDMRFEFLNNQDPSFKIEDRKQTITNFDALPSLFSGRIGIGYKL